MRAIKEEAMEDFEKEREATINRLKEWEAEVKKWETYIQEVEQEKQTKHQQQLEELQQQLQQAGEGRSRLQQQVIKLQEQLKTKDGLLQENHLQLEQVKGEKEGRRREK